MKKIWLFLCFVLGMSSLQGEWTKTIYPLSHEPIDVVIPCAPKDQRTLPACIAALRAQGKHLRRIIVVSSRRPELDVEWFSEDQYPFSKEDLAYEIFRGDKKKAKKFLRKKNSRIGWILQQFLKLYAPFVIPGISSNVLVVDADVLFLQPIEFMDGQGNPFFNTSEEHHVPYFTCMQRLLPELHRIHPQDSGVAHYMLLQKPILEDLFALVSQRHKTLPWKAMCRCIDPKEVRGSCFSEYETYFNFALLRTEQAKVRPLPFTDVYPLSELQKYRDLGYAYITSHERP